MRDRLCLDCLPYALGAILLGLVTLSLQDFALQWQPVPAGLPGRAPLAIASGVILILGALALLLKRAGRWRRLLPLFFALWVIVLHVPNVVAKPSLVSGLGLAEILSIAVGGWAALQGNPKSPISKTVRVIYGLCAVVFGLCHFQYADFTASMVPGWALNGHFWAYLTGAAHVAAGVAIATGIVARLAASMLAAMCGLFALLLHGPRVAAAPGDRAEWTMLAMAMLIAGGAWLMRRLTPSAIRRSLPSRKLFFEPSRQSGCRR